jgi:hypothetical protein
VRNFIIFVAFLAGISAHAQPVSFGLMGGAGLTGDFQNFSLYVGDGYTSIAESTPERWLAGATVEARLPFHFSIEVDGLFHELSFTTGSTGPQFLGNGQPAGPVRTTFSDPMHVVTWEFPVLVKYHLPLGFRGLKLFIDAGPAFRTSGNLNWTSPSAHGIAAGLGVEARWWKLRISPQFRYLRWRPIRIWRMSGSILCRRRSQIRLSF